MTLYRRQGRRSSLRKINSKGQNGSEEPLQIAEKLEEKLKAKEKRKDIPI